jgi:hypothetical protein
MDIRRLESYFLLGAEDRNSQAKRFSAGKESSRAQNSGFCQSLVSKWLRKMDHGQVEAEISHATKKGRYLKISRFYQSFASSEEGKGKQIAAVATAARKASPLLLFSLAEEEQEAVLLRSGKFRIVSSSGTVCVFLL